MQQKNILHVHQNLYKSEIRRAKFGIRPQLLRGWQWRFGGFQFNFSGQGGSNCISEREVFYELGELIEVYRLTESYGSSSEWVVTEEDLVLLKLYFAEIRYIPYSTIEQLR